MFFVIIRQKINIKIDVNEIVPPEAVLRLYERYKPSNTDIIPNNIDREIVFIIPCLNRKDAATGIIIIEDTTKSPTTFIDADIVALNKIEKSMLKKLLLNFDILANSSSKIINVNFLKYMINNVKTIKLVIIIKLISNFDSVNIFPKIMFSMFILTIPLLDIIIAIPKLKVKIIESEISEKFL